MASEKTFFVPYRDIFSAGNIKKFEIPDEVLDGRGISVKQGMTYNAGSSGNCGVQTLQNFRYGLSVQRWCVTKNSLYGDAQYPPSLRGSWDEFRRELHTEILNWIEKHGDEAGATLAEAVEDLVAELAKQRDGANCYILTDCCNRRSGFRGAVPAQIQTADLGEYLFRNKIGYTIESPVSLNHLHITENDISFAKVWIWYPPGAVVFKPNKFLGSGTILKTPEEAFEVAAKKPTIKANVDRKSLTLVKLKEAFVQWAKGAVITKRDFLGHT